ncbi:MAG: type II toxin-antitoxin system RelE/ParE family toxin, partial [Bacteroidales bacterium]|nr:type II toxin-antitoxin system RelE/ParE family toxin [Bacteroidales bacterium]
MAKYRLSKAAVKDLDAIWHYTVKQWSKQQASIYYREIASEVKNICKS